VLQGTTRDVSATGLQIAFPTASHSARAASFTSTSAAARAIIACRTDGNMLPARVVWTRDDAITGEVVCGIEFLATITACRGAA
jgi:hypothetical protein